MLSVQREQRTLKAEAGTQLARGALRGPAPCGRLRLGELRHRTAPCIASRTPRGFAGGALPVLRGRGAACCTPLAGDAGRVAVRGIGRRRRAPLKVGFAARRPLYRGGRSRGRSDRRRRPAYSVVKDQEAETGMQGAGDRKLPVADSESGVLRFESDGRLSGAAAAASRERGRGGYISIS